MDLNLIISNTYLHIHDSPEATLAQFRNTIANSDSALRDDEDID